MSPFLRQAGVAFKNARIQTAKVGAAAHDDAKPEAKHDSPARKRSIPGSGDDAAKKT